MKLLFINSSLRSGGAERVLSTLANHFAANSNYDIVIATYNHAKPDFYILHSAIKRIRFGTSIGSSLISKIFKRMQKIYRIRQIIKEEKPDVVLPLIIYTNIEVVIASLGLGVKVLVAEHSNYWAVKSKFFRFLRLIAYRYADTTVVLTKRDKEIYEQYLHNVTVIGNPISLDNSSDVELYERTETMLCVGTLYSVKQFDHVIEAFATLHHKYPTWKLQFAGDGKERENLQNLTRERKIEGKVEFLGNVTDIAMLYKQAGIFVLSSKHEGLPMVIGEAMLSGLPVISYDCPTGPSEFIDDGVSGLLVSPNNITELAQKMEELINAPNKREYLANNARDKIREFSAEKITAKWENLFKQGKR